MDGGSLFDMLNIVSKSSKQRVFSWYNRGRQVRGEWGGGSLWCNGNITAR